MKTISETAREYVLTKIGYDPDMGQGDLKVGIFKDAVAIAQQWIPVEEDLPDFITNSDIKHFSSAPILMKDNSKPYEWYISGYYVKLQDSFGIGDSKPCRFIDIYGSRVNATHWRLIELK